ncbi:MAG TPA: hypothetical protein VIF09_02885 [Polyangiaceae bacterium]
MARPALLSAALLVAACTGDKAKTSVAAAPTLTRSSNTGVVEPLLPDDEMGPLMARLSAAPGDFPSDNFVSNETSYLDVTPSLGEPALRDRAYVGVGPEQNYSYIALTRPAVAYIVDLRRGNLLEHLVLRGCFEASDTRVGFLSALLGRRPRAPGSATAVAGGFRPLAIAFASTRPDRALLEAGIARSRAVLDRLHVARAPGDDEAIARIHDAFSSRGLDLAFEMRNSGLPFPTLGEILAERSPDGEQRSFLASEERYRWVRRLVLANRVVPVVGDFGGRRALGAVADDMRARGLVLGVLYASNVEQYLFEAGTHGAFVASLRGMPRDDASLLVRVWLDPFRAHPLQRAGRRTTSLAVGVNAFLSRADSRPFASYWEVVTAPAALAP